MIGVVFDRGAWNDGIQDELLLSLILDFPQFHQHFRIQVHFFYDIPWRLRLVPIRRDPDIILERSVSPSGDENFRDFTVF